MKSKLNNNITKLVIVITLLLIISYTAIEMLSQMRSINAFNSIKADLTAQMLKEDLYKALKENSGRNPAKLFSQLLNSYLSSSLINTAVIYTPDGKVIASMPEDINGKPSDIELSKIKESLNNNTDNSYKTIHLDRGKSLQLYIPIESNGKIKYIARLDEPLATIYDAFARGYLSIIVVVMVTVVSAIFFLLIIRERLIKPLSLLNAAAKAVAEGDNDLRISIDTDDELSELADHFNMLSIELKKAKSK